MYLKQDKNTNIFDIISYTRWLSHCFKTFLKYVTSYKMKTCNTYQRIMK